jgi:hypothetical protein
MLGRALILATVTLLISDLAAPPAQAQNLEAGKTPSQLFAGNCTACHKSPRGLLKTVAPGSLPGFLRQHYTTSPDMAGALSSYLISNGAADTKHVGGQGRAAKPDADPADPQAEPGRKKRHRKPKPAEDSAMPADSQTAIRQQQDRGATASSEPAGQPPATRPDPVPAVTPAATTDSAAR